MTNLTKINYIVTKVFDIADEYNINVVSDLTTNMINGSRILFFSFRKNRKRVDAVVDEKDIYLVKEIDLIVNSITEKMKELL